MSKSDEIKIGNIKFTSYKDGLAVIPHKEETTSIYADEMFEEIGYNRTIYKDCIDYRKRINKDVKNITFWIHTKTVESYQEINMQELQAINKKCKELGWI